jgi:hypothetical protein
MGVDSNATLLFGGKQTFDEVKIGAVKHRARRMSRSDNSEPGVRV